MFYYFAGLVGVYLICMSVLVKTDNYISTFVFNILPVVIAFPLIFFAFAHYMGWPVQ